MAAFCCSSTAALVSGRTICWRADRFDANSVIQFTGNRFWSWRNAAPACRIVACGGIGGRAPQWKADESPYEILELETSADEDDVKAAYRSMVKQYHPDVYSGEDQLPEGETIEMRFIKIQAAYELLMDSEARRNYDIDNRSNPMKASKAWMEWLVKRKQAFEQRGDMAAAFWEQQQNREMSLKARQLSKHKLDPGEEKRILAKSKQVSATQVETTMKRHTLVLKKRDILRRRVEEEQLVHKLLAAEGLELEEDDHQSQRD